MKQAQEENQVEIRVHHTTKALPKAHHKLPPRAKTKEDNMSHTISKKYKALKIKNEELTLPEGGNHENGAIFL